jgi:transposase InsO family protein
MASPKEPPGHRRWGRFRLGVIGPLLSAPPDKGQLSAAIQALASKAWLHPISGQRVRFAASSIERWYYAARDADDPVSVLARQLRRDRGTHPSMTGPLVDALRSQYELHKSWSYQLHADNLRAMAEQESLGEPPSYSTVLRYMRGQGMLRQPKPKRETKGTMLARSRVEAAEVRSYEASYVDELWHYDFHVGSQRIMLPTGEWATPELFGSLDDFSRLACHVQWYLQENAENVAHGLSQAFQKRRLPRSILSDNGAGMTAGETLTGLDDLGITPETTLSASPYQNGKQESFWTQIEGRLLPLLERVEGLTLEQLNEATQAWVEMEYNREVHSETGEAPIRRYLTAKSVGREAPSSARLRDLFTRPIRRAQRKSDGTVSIDGIRFEIPSRFRHVDRLHLRYAEWDLTRALVVDPETDEILARLQPLDKVANADGQRRSHQPVAAPRIRRPLLESPGVAPLMKKLLTTYAEIGLPPAYVPKHERNRASGGEV